MGSLTVLYDNFADGGILSGGSWLSALPLTNMLDQDIQLVARSSNATNAATLFKVDLGSPKTVDGIAFGPVNASPGSTWRVRGYSDSSYTMLVYDSTVQTVTGEVVDWSDTAEWLEWEDTGFWLGIAEPLDELPQFLFHIPTTAQIAQYWKFELFDATNADGFIEIGRLLIARAFKPSINYSEDNAFGLLPLTDMEESLGGKRVFWERGQRRTFRAALPFLTQSESMGEGFRLMLRAGIGRQVFVSPDPDDDVSGIRRSFLATMKQIPAIQQLLVERAAMSVDLEEVL